MKKIAFDSCVLSKYYKTNVANEITKTIRCFLDKEIKKQEQENEDILLTIPSIVLSELLLDMFSLNERKELQYLISKQFMILTYNTKAVKQTIDYWQMYKIKHENKLDDFKHSRYCIKDDCKILGICKAHQIDTIYTIDGDLGKLLPSNSQMQIVNISEIEYQPELDF
jgi:predicted nucleic acid-binding protein